MKTGLMQFNWVSLTSIIVSAIAAVIIYVVLADKKLPIISNHKIAFYILWIIGLSMSMLAGWRDAPDGNFIMPKLLRYFLMILGFLAFLLLFKMIFGVKISFIPTYRDAFIALAIIIGLKWSAVHLYKLVKAFF